MSCWSSNFVRLSPTEQELLFWFAVERDATGIRRMEDNLVASANVKRMPSRRPAILTAALPD